MSKVRIGVIGAGGIAHAHLPRLQERSDAVEIIGISDVNAETAKTTAEQYGVTRHGTDYRDWLAEADAVVICVPTLFHADIAIEALNAGKHVFCEKPMARTLEQSEAMVAAAKSSGKALQIGFVRRFDDEWLSYRDSLQAGKVGKPVVWRHVMSNAGPSNSKWFTDEKIGGGPFLDGCIHNIDFALYTFGEAEWVFLHGRTIHPENTAVDTGTATIHFKSGDELMLAWSWGLPKGAGGASLFEFFGPKGTLLGSGEPADEDGNRYYVINNGHSQENVSFPSSAIATAFRDQVDEFIEVAQGNKQPRADENVGHAVGRVCLALLESAKSGEVVRL